MFGPRELYFVKNTMQRGSYNKISLFLCDHGKLKVKTKIMRKKIVARVQNFDRNKPRPASPKLQCYAKQSFNLLWPYLGNLSKFI